MKRKGSEAERELVQMLWGAGLGAIRVAGSGVSKFPCPDVVASNGSRVLAIECKSTKHKIKYIEPEQVSQLEKFSKLFGAEPWLAVKFSTEWYFYKLEDLEKTKGGKFAINLETSNKRFLVDIT
jgi:Holliday junction resolvase